jgi:hypothetical protein
MQKSTITIIKIKGTLFKQKIIFKKVSANKRLLYLAIYPHENQLKL